MGFVYETISTTDVKPDVALGIKLSSDNSIFKSIYSIADQTKENLKSLLLTRIGERYMLPEFGTNLLNMLFEPITYEFNSSIQNSVTSAIQKWLPYVVIQEFKVVTALDDPSLQHMVEMTLTYSVKNFSTNTIKIFASETGDVSVV
jgi:phage baseplate assembly protein W